MAPLERSVPSSSTGDDHVEQKGEDIFYIINTFIADWLL